jgi:hypothetical protein
MQCQFCDEEIEQEVCDCYAAKEIQSGSLLRTPGMSLTEDDTWRYSGLITQPVFYE